MLAPEERGEETEADAEAENQDRTLPIDVFLSLFFSLILCLLTHRSTHFPISPHPFSVSQTGLSLHLRSVWIDRSA